MPHETMKLREAIRDLARRSRPEGQVADTQPPVRIPEAGGWRAEGVFRDATYDEPFGLIVPAGGAQIIPAGATARARGAATIGGVLTVAGTLEVLPWQ